MTNGFLRIIAQLAIAFVCLLPMRWAAHLGRGCGQLAYLVDARHRRVARKNLSCTFPNKSPREISELVRENFRRIGENICCAIKSSSMDEITVASVLDVRRSDSEISRAAFNA